MGMSNYIPITFPKMTPYVPLRFLITFEYRSWKGEIFVEREPTADYWIGTGRIASSYRPSSWADATIAIRPTVPLVANATRIDVLMVPRVGDSQYFDWTFPSKTRWGLNVFSGDSLTPPILTETIFTLIKPEPTNEEEE